MAYCIAIVLMFLKVFLMVTMGILRFSFSIFIDGMWAVARAPAVRTISGSIFHPLEAILSISGLYLLFFCFYSLWGKSVITICEFNKLYGEVRVNVSGRVILIW